MRIDPMPPAAIAIIAANHARKDIGSVEHVDCISNCNNTYKAKLRWKL